MKTLYIIRHAKSFWAGFNQTDHERQLSETGREHIQKIVEFLRTKAVRPQVILASSARRTIDTARWLSDGLGLKEEIIRSEPALYLADEEKISEEIGLQSDDFNQLMVIGHNPGITDFVNLFLKNPIDLLPTSAVVCFTFDTTEWENFRHKEAQLQFIVFPKEL